MSLGFAYKIKTAIFCSLLMGSLSQSAASAQSTATSDSTSYTLIYIIHGDGDYLYHDVTNSMRYADEKVLEEAVQIAENALTGEVLIFHQRPETKILGIFPKKDRRFLHYQNGDLIRETTYSPKPGSTNNPFTAESELFHENGSGAVHFRSLLYFGHEIPGFEQRQYDRPGKRSQLNAETFEAGTASFARDKPLDLIVLSTCNNGTPRMAGLLSNHSRVLLASPQNLHLSHIDTREFKRLEKNPFITPVELANRIANATFQRLRRTVQTVVSLSVYDLNSMRQSLKSFSSQYRKIYSHQPQTSVTGENIDCSNLSSLKDSTLLPDNDLYYRPPRFGPDSGITQHSGWGCKPLD